MDKQNVFEFTDDEVNILKDALNCLLNEMTPHDYESGYEAKVQALLDSTSFR